MKRGFVLLEVVIASLIAALLSTGLLTAIFQMTRLQEAVNTATSVYGRVAILQNQLERDVMGAFIPTQVDVIQTTTEKRSQQAKPIEKIFYGKVKDGQLDVLTCITTNPMQIYFGVKDVKLKPRIARVVYRLVPDKRRKNSYVLMRQEGTRNLAFDVYTHEAEGDLRSYAMIDGIQRFEVKYGIIEQEVGDDEKKTVKRAYKKQKEWDSQKKQEERQKHKLPPRLPNDIEVTVSLWDSVYKSGRQFVITIPIVAMSGEFIRKQDEKKHGNELGKRSGKKTAEKGPPKPAVSGT